MKKGIFSLGFVALAVCLLSFVSSSRGVVKDKYPFLAGEYELIVIYNEGKVEEPVIEGKITMKITKSDAMMIYNNGKKISKFTINDGRAPLSMGNEDYVMFNLKNENFPLFYKGDSIIQFIYPNEYSDNYFRKTK